MNKIKYSGEDDYLFKPSNLVIKHKLFKLIIEIHISTEILESNYRYVITKKKKPTLNKLLNIKP